MHIMHFPRTCFLLPHYKSTTNHIRNSISCYEVQKIEVKRTESEKRAKIKQIYDPFFSNAQNMKFSSLHNFTIKISSRQRKTARKIS